MYYYWICAATILGIVSTLPMQSHIDGAQLMKAFQPTEVGRNNAIETIIINAMEDLREIMVTGSEDIPVLDPLQVQHLYVDDSIIPIPGAYLELNNLEVSKLSTFDMTEVSVETTSVLLQRYHAQIQGEIPLVNIQIGQYDLSVDFWGLKIFGKGDSEISMTRPWLRIDTNVNIRLGVLALYLNIRDLRLDFGLDDIQFDTNGMFNIPMVDDFVNKFMRNLILELVEFWGDELSDIISPIALDVANDILRDLNLIDLIG